MSYRHTLEAAVESMHEIEDLIKGFPESGNIPMVEIDLALQKLRNLYELMLMMRGKGEKEEKLAGAAVAVSGEKEEKLAGPAAEVTEVEVKREESRATEVAVTVSVEEKKVQTVKKTTKEGDIKTLSDQFKGRTTLLESLHQSFTGENETRGHAKPVADLLSAIAINDRFTFIRELFNNDKKAFEGTIAILNEAGSYNDAFNYMVSEFDWDMDGDTVQLLLNFVSRRYNK